MKTHLLTAHDVDEVVADVGAEAVMSDLISRLKETMAAFDSDDYEMPARSGISYESPAHGLLEWMPVHRADADTTVKIVGYHPANPKAHGIPSVTATICSFDGSGRLTRIADATLITALRTGAMSAIATGLLGSKSSRTLGLIGLGAQAVTQVHALTLQRDWDCVLVHDISPAVAETFEQRLAGVVPTGTNIVVSDKGTLLADSDVICTATSQLPGSPALFEDVGLKPWVHVNAVGSDFAGKTELPLGLLERSFVVPDHLQQALTEGECQQLPPDSVEYILADLCRDSDVAKAHRDQPTVFDSTGWALADRIGLGVISDLALERGIGHWIEMSSEHGDPLSPYAFPSRVAREWSA